MEAALKPAGIFEATNLATRADEVLPNPLSGSAVTPKSLRGTSSGLSGRDLNSLWRSPTSSFWSVDFPAVIYGEPDWVGDQGVRGSVPPHRSLIDLDTGTSAIGLFSLRATKICTISVPDNGQSSIGGEVSAGGDVIKGRGLLCDVSVAGESTTSRGEGVGNVMSVHSLDR